MARKRNLRAVADDERPGPPPTMLEAVESGDWLALKRAQLRLMVESAMSAGENTRPQYDQRISKLTGEIQAEEERRAVNDHERSVVEDTPDDAWDGTGF